MQKLVLIRGLPGSGKSTMAKQRYQGHAHFEADQFMHDGQAYRYEQARVPLAHSLCQTKTRQALKKGESVVVSNTFTKHQELQPYLEMAAELGVRVEVVVATGNFQNVHDVPEERIEVMRNRWEPYKQQAFERGLAHANTKA